MKNLCKDCFTWRSIVTCHIIRSNVTGDKVGHFGKSKQTWWVGPPALCDVTKEEVYELYTMQIVKLKGEKVVLKLLIIVF